MAGACDDEDSTAGTPSADDAAKPAVMSAVAQAAALQREKADLERREAREKDKQERLALEQAWQAEEERKLLLEVETLDDGGGDVLPSDLFGYLVHQANDRRLESRWPCPGRVIKLDLAVRLRLV